jgi:hypothetical protein
MHLFTNSKLLITGDGIFKKSKSCIAAPKSSISWGVKKLIPVSSPKSLAYEFSSII